MEKIPSLAETKSEIFKTNLSLQDITRVLKDRYFKIEKKSFQNAVRTFLYVLVGSIIIFPIVCKLPLLGWDWYYFFNANNPDYNILSLRSAYPPFTKYIIQLFLWMNWRSSLALLNSITIMTVAIATWKNGGKYLDITLAITTPALWFLMWIGHPDGLVLLGLITGIIPLILMKPILSPFGLLSDRKLIAWSALFLFISLILWPGWIFMLRQATFWHEAAIGWVITGWPLLILGFLLFIGAGKDPYKLMAAGCFITPYLMPYHMAVLSPAFGKVHKWRKIILWIAAWGVVVGTGLGGTFNLVSFIYPLLSYCLSGTFDEYKSNVRVIIVNMKFIFSPKK